MFVQWVLQTVAFPISDFSVHCACIAAYTLLNIFVMCCIWHKFVRAVRNLSQCGRVCRIWTHTKIFVTSNAHDPVIGFFKHQRDLRRNIVIVWTYLWMCSALFKQTPMLITDAQRKSYVARTFNLRRKFVRWIFTFNTQQKYLLMWTRLKDKPQWRTMLRL